VARAHGIFEEGSGRGGRVVGWGRGDQELSKRRTIPIMRFLIPLRHDLRRTNSNRTDPLKALIVAHIDMRLLEKVRIKPVLILRQGISFGFLVDGFEDLEPHFATNLLLAGAVLVFGDVEDGGLFWGAAVD